MKVVILAGGLGTRLAEETELKPKPMVEIGGMPILWHIMRHYAHYGFNEFVVALGYKGEYVKKWFADYASLSGNVTVHLGKGYVEVENKEVFDWKVQLIDTGQNTNTGGRVKRIIPYVENQTFMMTWGDGVSTVDIPKLLAFHKGHGKLATVTAVHPPPRFGQLVIENNRVSEFTEKPLDTSWINGGFFVLEPEVAGYVDHEDIDWSREPMQRMAAAGELMAHQHEGFWQPMDALRDKYHLEKLWASGKAPWKIWDEKAQDNEKLVFSQI